MSDTKEFDTQIRSADSVCKGVTTKMLSLLSVYILSKEWYGRQKNRSYVPSSPATETQNPGDLLAVSVPSHRDLYRSSPGADVVKAVVTKYQTEMMVAVDKFLELIPKDVWTNLVAFKDWVRTNTAERLKADRSGKGFDYGYGYGTSRKLSEFLDPVKFDKWGIEFIKAQEPKAPKSIPPTYRCNGYGSEDEFKQDTGHMGYSYFNNVGAEVSLWFAKQVVTKSDAITWTTAGVRFDAVDKEVVMKDSGIRLAREFRDLFDNSGRYLLPYLLLDFDYALTETGLSKSEVPAFPETPLSCVLKNVNAWQDKVYFLTATVLDDRFTSKWVEPSSRSTGDDEGGEDTGVVQVEQIKNSKLTKNNTNSIEAARGILRSALQYLDNLEPQYLAQRERIAANSPELLEEVATALRGAGQGLQLALLFNKHILVDECKRSELILMTGFSEQNECTNYQSTLALIGELVLKYQRDCSSTSFIKAFNSELKSLANTAAKR